METETNNTDENLTDIVNQLVGETSQAVEDEPQVDIEVARKEEQQARGAGVKEIKQAQNTAVVQEARKAAGSYKQQMEAMKNELEQTKKLVKMMADKQGKVEKDLQVHSDRMLTDDVIAEENNLAKHPVYGKDYDREAVRKYYVEKAQKEQRFFRPEEAMKILNYDKIAKKLEQYERQNEFRKSLMEGAFSTSNPMPETDGLADVRTPDDADAWMRKKAGELGL